MIPRKTATVKFKAETNSVLAADKLIDSGPCVDVDSTSMLVRANSEAARRPLFGSPPYGWLSVVACVMPAQGHIVALA